MCNQTWTRSTACRTFPARSSERHCKGLGRQEKHASALCACRHRTGVVKPKECPSSPKSIFWRAGNTWHRDCSSAQEVCAAPVGPQVGLGCLGVATVPRPIWKGRPRRVSASQVSGFSIPFPRPCEVPSARGPGASPFMSPRLESRRVETGKEERSHFFHSSSASPEKAGT